MEKIIYKVRIPIGDYKRSSDHERVMDVLLKIGCKRSQMYFDGERSVIVETDRLQQYREIMQKTNHEFDVFDNSVFFYNEKGQMLCKEFIEQLGII